jgi:beta-glucanase (GH16 family)
MLPPPGYSHLIFDDMFSGLTLNSTKWIPQIADQTGIWNDNGKLPYPYSAVGNEGKYNAEYGNTDQVVVNNGLTLNAQRDNTFSGYSWKAGYIDTHNKFTFNQGFVQVRAKMPDSTTGGWASIWFLEGGGEIDLQESGYTGCGRSVVNQCLAMNLHTSGNKQILYNTGVDLSATYHIYGMEYKPGQSITMYFDGKQVAQFTSNIPTGAYTIILTETIAQNASGWHTVASNSTPSPMSPFQTSEVQVWTLDIPTPASLITAIPTLTFTPMPTPTPTVFNIIPPMVSITKRRMLDT